MRASSSSPYCSAYVAWDVFIKNICVIFECFSNVINDYGIMKSSSLQAVTQWQRNNSAYGFKKKSHRHSIITTLNFIFFFILFFLIKWATSIFVYSIISHYSYLFRSYASLARCVSTWMCHRILWSGFFCVFFISLPVLERNKISKRFTCRLIMQCMHMEAA